MRPGARVAVVAAAAGAWAGIAAVQGGAAALLALFSAAALGLLAAWVSAGGHPAQPSLLVATGIAALLEALGLLAFGAVGSGALGGLAAAAVVFAGAQASLARHAFPPEVTPPRTTSVATTAAVAADEAMKAVWRITSLATLPGRPDLHAVADELRASAERNRQSGVLEDPGRAHPRPPALEKVRLARRGLAGLGEVEHLRFDSEFDPSDPEVRDSYLAAAANRTAHAWLWRHRGTPRPALLCLHGLGMGRAAWDAHAFGVPWLHQRLGLDVVLPVLPLHGPRATGLRSGAGFLDGHPLWTSAAFAQALFELRRLAGWLRGQGAPAVGVLGISLGGAAAALLASLDPRLACAVPWVPAANLLDVIDAERSERDRLAREAAGITRELLAEAWAPHDPLRHRPRVAAEARLIVAGLLDRIAPPEHAHALWEHWDRPPIHWFPGSHLLQLGRGHIRERLEAHLRSTLLAPGASALPLTRFRGA